MKKLLVLFVAVAATISSFAASTVYYFNRAQFQWSSPSVKKELESIAPKDLPLAAGKVVGTYNGQQDFNVQVTVPFIYKGTISFATDWVYEPTVNTLTLNQRRAAKCVVNTKASYPAVMTMCQPCIDCYPCATVNSDSACAEAGIPWEGIFGAVADEWKEDGGDPAIRDYANVWGYPGYITTWNLYVIAHVDKKSNPKAVYYYKINLIADDDNAARFFTGPQKGNVYAKYQTVDANEGQINLQLSGSKSDYVFEYYTKYLSKAGGYYHWEALSNNLGAKQKAFIKAPKALNGTIYYNFLTGGTPAGEAYANQLQVLDVAGTVKLTRNAALTKEAIKSTFAVTVKKNKIKNWDDCQEADPESSTCEEYLALDGLFEVSYFGAQYKKYEPIDLSDEGTFEEFFGDIYDPSEQAAFKAFFEATEDSGDED